jgi:hypothetical protein
MLPTLILAAALSGQSCYGSTYQGSAYAAPLAATQVDEVTTTTTRSYTLPAPQPQAFAAPRQAFGTGSCGTSSRFGAPYGAGSCTQALAAPQPVYGGVQVAGNFGDVPPAGGFGGGLSVNSRRRVVLKNNRGLGNLGAGGPVQINTRRRVIIKGNSF